MLTESDSINLEYKTVKTVTKISSVSVTHDLSRGII